MANITIPSDFLNSDLRQAVLYQLVMSLVLEISETAFRSIITELNLKFFSPRIAFSALYAPQEITIYYSTSDLMPTISQRDIVFALKSSFNDYSPSILYEKSEGEISGGVPIIPVKATEPRPLFSFEWIPIFFTDMTVLVKEEVKQVAEDVVDEIEKLTGWPRWAIPYILATGAISVTLLILYLKMKPVLVIKTKGS